MKNHGLEKLFIKFAMIFALVAVKSASAGAELQICNQTLSVLNVAVGLESGEKYQTEGWWTLPANGCVSVIRRKLESRYLYVFASDIHGKDILSGVTEMCIDRKQFVINGIKGCWQRGYEQAKFHEVDTKSASDWTLFIREKPQN